MRTWYNGEYIELYVGQVVTVYRRGQDHKLYGELATLTRSTKRYLVFTTDSGATVKTRVDNLHVTVGEARERHYRVSPKPVDAFPHMIHQEVRCGDSARRASAKE